MNKMKVSWLLVLALASLGRAQTGLDTLRASLAGMRGKDTVSEGPRGASPRLTIAKHQLRDWVESKMRSLPRDAEEQDFARKLNSEIREAKLSCAELGAQPCPEWSLLGYLRDISFRRSTGFLILQTGVGIECGFDESVYLYSWSEEGWRRVWQNEQNIYTEKAYKPQDIHSVVISPYSQLNEYLVLTLGSETWCQSTLHNVYYRAYHLGPDLEASPLVDGSAGARIDGDPPIRGNITATDILVEFEVANGGIGGQDYEAVRHYRIDRDRETVRRVHPFALSPRNFVTEWLNQDWRESAPWSEPASRRSMREWHSKWHADPRAGEFTDPTMHCPQTPDLWQVGIDLSDHTAEPKGPYFTVRWRPPYNFTMVAISDHPSPACSEEDRAADEARTLFPFQERR